MHATILIVDGSHRLRETLISAMDADDVRWVEPDDGSDVLSTISALRPTLVVLDADMPAPGGLELLRRIKADPDSRDMPVIAVGSHANDADVVRALELGASDYLVEPLSARHVLRRGFARPCGRWPFSRKGCGFSTRSTC